MLTKELAIESIDGFLDIGRKSDIKGFYKAAPMMSFLLTTYVEVLFDVRKVFETKSSFISTSLKAVIAFESICEEEHIKDFTKETMVELMHFFQIYLLDKFFSENVQGKC